MPQHPLCVDLDGTLVKSDSLLESLVHLARYAPRKLWLLPWWLLKGKAYFKFCVSRVVELDAAALPYDHELLDFLTQEYRLGRTLILATAAQEKIASGIAAHLGIFSGVSASTPTINLKGEVKAACLARRWGEKNGFSYIGNASEDLPVWKQAKEAMVVRASASLLNKARRSANVVRTFSSPYSRLRDAFFLIKALRPHQWIKNILIFLPLVAAHQMGNFPLLLRAILACSAFCAAASSAYLFNDLADLDADRQHPIKRRRPFAAGDLPLSYGLLGIPLLLLVSLSLGALLSWQIAAALLAYYLLTLAYSLYFKRIVLLDVIVLSLLYGARIYTGALATDVRVSTWLLIFSIFLFFSLALAKRAGEIIFTRRQSRITIPGRSYSSGDLSFIFTIGISSGYMSVLIFALYINSEMVGILYASPQLLWPLCVILLYWMSHIWLKVHRGEMLSDPIVFAFKDPLSYIIAALTMIFLLAAWGYHHA